MNRDRVCVGAQRVFDIPKLKEVYFLSKHNQMTLNLPRPSFPHKNDTLTDGTPHPKILSHML